MDRSLKFHVEHTCGSARAGVLVTSHGRAPTPAFMPVATQGSVKALGPDEVEEIGARIVLANAYHLGLRPGVGLVRQLGGLHAFSGWDGPMLTDSGGFQAFSLGRLGRLTEDGLLFRSHIDGSEHLLTPESSMRDQLGLGADIIMCLDQCIAVGEGREAVGLAMERTHRWALRCRNARRCYPQGESGALFGIVQGGVFEDMRRESAEYVTSLGFDGYAIGGLAVGESKAEMYAVAELVTPLLPADRPRYLMGVGAPEDLVECVYRGVDMFDCAMPTRVARNGALYTPQGRVDITSGRFRDMAGPVQDDCDCYACRRFSAAYLHHLFKTKELLGLRLASMHNLRFVLRLMEDMRRAIAEGELAAFRRDFLAEFTPTDERARQSNKEAWMRARGMLGSSGPAQGRDGR